MYLMVKSFSLLELHVPVLAPSQVKGQQCLNYIVQLVVWERDMAS